MLEEVWVERYPPEMRRSGGRKRGRRFEVRASPSRELGLRRPAPGPGDRRRAIGGCELRRGLWSKDRGSNSGTRLRAEFFLENFLCGGGSQLLTLRVSLPKPKPKPKSTPTPKPKPKTKPKPYPEGEAGC